MPQTQLSTLYPAPTFKLFFFAPYTLEKRLGKAYNDYMDMVPSDQDWVCFFDRDVLFLTHDYGHQITEIIHRNQSAGLLTCLTNRIGCKPQLYQGRLSNDPDILKHRQIAEQLQRSHRHDVDVISAPVSGFLMVIKKSVWKKVQFDANRKLLGVDHDFSNRVARKRLPILLMRGVYVFHYYRLAEGGSTAHLL